MLIVLAAPLFFIESAAAGEEAYSLSQMFAPALIRGQSTDAGRFWTDFYYAGSSLKPKEGGVKIRPDQFGVQLGFDLPKTEYSWRTFFLSIGQSNTEIGNIADSEVNHFQFGLGKRLEWNVAKQGGYVGYTASLTYDDYKIRDMFTNVSHSGSGLQANASGEAAVCWGNDQWKIRPFYGLQYDFLYHGRIGEEGSAILSDESEHSLQQMLGVRLSRNFFYTFDIQVRASWVHQYLGDTPAFFTNRFSSISGTSIPTPAVPFYGGDVGRDWAWIGTGVQFDFYNWFLFFDYDLLLNERQTSHVGSMMLCLTW